MLIITGAYGFIGSILVQYLNEMGHTNLILVDDFSRIPQAENIANTQYLQKIERSKFINWLKENYEGVKYIFHLGARTDTTETDIELFDRLNLNYTKDLWHICTQQQIPLLYASSAATYGLGEHGYIDNHEIVEKLAPLNAYGNSKNDFDIWALKQTKQPPFWAGLKFFNVYGPQEYHKGRMASVVFHTFKQIKATGAMKLFRSHRADIADGQQSRDFIYVKDVVKICYFFYRNQEKKSGLYNVGTGQARPFIDLATLTFQAMGLTPKISFIDTPLDIRDKYQYFTEADLTKLRAVGYSKKFYSLEEGVQEYVQEMQKKLS